MLMQTYNSYKMIVYGIQMLEEKTLISNKKQYMNCTKLIYKLCLLDCLLSSILFFGVEVVEIVPLRRSSYRWLERDDRRRDCCALRVL